MATAVSARCSIPDAVTGAGPPVLLLPGWCVTPSGWGAVIPRLAERHMVIAVDNSAAPFGLAGRHGGGIAAMAAAAVAVLDDAGLCAAHVVGNSLGGLVAQALATRHPERVLSLVLLSTSPRGLRELPRVHARTLVIHGSRDRVVPLANARLLASLVPCAQLIVVAGAGHLILTDAQEQVADAIAEFLTGPNVLREGPLGMMVLPRAS